MIGKTLKAERPDRGIIYRFLLPGFILASVVKEIFILISLTGNPGVPVLFFTVLTIAVILIIYLLTFLLSKPVLFIILYCLHQIYLFAHLSYNAYFHTFLDIFRMLGVAGEGLGMVVKGILPLTSRMWVLTADLPLAVLLVIFYKRVRRELRTFFGIRKLFLIPLFVIVIMQGLLLFAEIPAWDVYSKKRLLALHGTLGYSFVNMLVGGTAAAEKDAGYSEESGLSAKSGYGPRHWPGNPAGTPNFILVQIESFQCGLENIKYDDRYIMPYVHSLTKEGLYYPYCFAYHSVGATSDCEFSVFNNIEPTAELRLVTRGYTYPKSFIKILNMYGYTALAFHNYNKTYFYRGTAYGQIGFSYFYDFDDMQMTPPKWVSQDREMFEFILKRTSEWKQPFLHYIINLSSHPGFAHIVAYHKAPFLDSITNKRDRNALTCFNYVDQQLQQFVETARETFPDLWIFIYGDHSLPTVDFAGLLTRSGVAVDGDFMEFVPLIILAPDGRSGFFGDTLASFHDIGPTVLSLLPDTFGQGGITYEAFGGSLLYDDVRGMPVPFRGTLYDRGEILERIKAVMEEYIDPASG